MTTMWQTFVSHATAAGNIGSHMFAGCCDDRMAESNRLLSEQSCWRGLLWCREPREMQTAGLWVSDGINSIDLIWMRTNSQICLYFFEHISDDFHHWRGLKTDFNYVVLFLSCLTLVKSDLPTEQTRFQSSRDIERWPARRRARRAAD